MVGYASSVPGVWRLWDPVSGVVNIFKDVRFDEAKMMGCRPVGVPDTHVFGFKSWVPLWGSEDEDEDEDEGGGQGQEEDDSQDELENRLLMQGMSEAGVLM